MRKNLVTIISLLLMLSMVGIVSAQDKIVVKKLEDLPKISYETKGNASDILADKSAFNKLKVDVKTDLKKIFKKYDIQDKTTVKTYLGMMLTIAMLEEDFEVVKKLNKKIKSLEDKDAEKAMSGMTSLSMAMAKAMTKGAEEKTFKAFEKIYSKKVNSLNYELVGDRVKELKANYEIRSENLIMGFVKSQLDPSIEKAGNISFSQAGQILSFENNFRNNLKFKDVIVKVLTEYVNKHKVEKEDIWTAMDVAFTGNEDYKNVRVGIWDSGVDTKIYKDQLFTNSKEVKDGKDNDGNGFIDDMHGLAFDLKGDYSTDLLWPVPAEFKESLPQLIGLVKGFTDLQSGLDTEDASKVKRFFSKLKPDEVNPLLEGFSAVTLYMHGTHVAGIAVNGNPFAEVVVARLEFDYKSIPALPTKEWAKKEAQNFINTCNYFKANGVRVVNMSWGNSPSEIEAALEANGVGKDAEERKAKAMELFKIYDEGLYTAIKNTPEVLYITSAGNSDNDVNFDKMIPSSYDLPNIMTVGAVDIAGDQTSFTSFGKSVDIYANGFEVESYIPGGDKQAASGTSMSSPNVTNLAAKIFTVNPKLTVKQAVELIMKGAVISKDGNFLLMNPKKTIGMAKKSM